MNKDLISGFDLTNEDINKIFKKTKALKKNKYNFILKQKVVALVFQKPSMRTRVSFEAGVRQLGGDCIYLAPQDIQLGKRELIKDVARVMARYVDLIVARTFSHEHINELAEYAEVSVINGLSDLYHPCQALADIFTIYEKKAGFKGIKLAYIGDGNNVLNSLLAIAAKVGLSINVATPKGYMPDKKIWQEACVLGKKNKTVFTWTQRPEEAIKGADFVYTDVWTSMGQEEESAQRRRDFKPFQLNSGLIKKSQKETMIMHCMPMHRDEEITDEVAESKHSIIIDQAENRLHVQKAVMALLIKS
ncbi:MAG: ornithine carbamoyltransferase [Candidatus Omnitrophota bacterium]